MSANWWGSEVESNITGLNYGTIDYTPWLANGTDLSTAVGFQADMSVLNISAASPQTGSTGRIQEGVNLVSGSTVNVIAGTYNETAILNKNITLSSASIPLIQNLTMNTPAVAFGGSFKITGTLNLTSGQLRLGTNNLILGTSASVTGSPSMSSMVVTDGTGEMRKKFNSSSTFTFPMGDSLGTDEYSPVTLQFTSGEFLSAYVGVRVINSSHPNLNSYLNYLKRYWKVTSSGVTNFQCNATFKYADGDVMGTETELGLGKWDGSAWLISGFSDPGQNTLYGPALDTFSDFTGGDAQALPVQIASFVGYFVSGKGVVLDWSTLSEVNNFGFNIQRYNNTSLSFDNIGFVEGNGTTLEPQTYSFIDKYPNGSEIKYRLEQLDKNGLKHYTNPIIIAVNPDGIKNGQNVPAVFALCQNYPNPFNPTTNISFSLAENNYTTLRLFDILGEEVALLYDGNAEAGKLYVINYNASNLPSGLYIYKLQSGKNIEVKKMMLLK